MRVIVGTATKVGDIGLYFPPGGILGREFASKHNLLKSQGGYLPDNKPRIEALKLRGIQSYGLFVPDDSFTEGQLIGVPICEKYYSLKQRERVNGVTSKTKREAIGLPKHYDTAQLWNIVSLIKPAAHFEITEKLHGTSGRSGWIKKPRARTWLGRLRDLFSRDKYIYICGSRNVEFDPSTPAPGARGEIHEALREHIGRGEVWYYELIGCDNGTQIQPSLQDPETKEWHHYSYGLTDCVAFVYRITGADGKDLLPAAVRAKVEVIDDSRIIPLLPCFTGIVTEDTNVIEIASRFANQNSRYCKNLASEGVVVVFHDERQVLTVGKLKSFKFCQMEGIAYGGTDYVDPEEVS